MWIFLLTTTAALLLATGIRYAETLRLLLPLLDASPRTELAFPTRDLKGARFWILFVCFILRSLARRIGLWRRTIFSVSNKDELECTVEGPSTSLSMPFHLTRSDIEMYNRAVFPDHKNDPNSILDDDPHLLLLLSALTEPAMLLLLAKINCPMDPVGSVNVRNRFEFSNKAGCRTTLRSALDCSPHSMYVTAQMDRTVKKVKRGWEFSVIVELHAVDGVLFRQVFTMLDFAKHSRPPPTVDTAEIGTTLSQHTFRLKSDDPSAWAQLCKDYNPIHTSAMAGRLLGMPGKIAHGNHIIAKALGSLKTQSDTTADWLEVEFRRPVIVPTLCEVKVSERGIISDVGLYGEVRVREKLMAWFKYGSG